MRHARQERLAVLGSAGQERLEHARVVIVGLGATGSHLAELLGRMGVGRQGWLRLVDRDVVEESNLSRQALFRDADARALRPKAEAAAEALAAIDPALCLQPLATELSPTSAVALLDGADLVLDGTDSIAARLLLNDACVKLGKPWVHAAVVGTEGRVLALSPGGPCLRCYVPEAPPAGSLPGCDVAGVLGSAAALVAAVAATEAVKLLVDGRAPAELVVLEAWSGTLRRVALPRDPACPCCVRGRFPFLDEPEEPSATLLCGRAAVHLPASDTQVDLDALERRLARQRPGQVLRSGRALLRIETADRRVLLFADGRAVVAGTRDAAEARALRDALLA